MKVSRPISPILILKLVAMAMTLKQSEKEGQISNLRSNIYNTVTALVKIDPVNTEIIRLKGLF